MIYGLEKFLQYTFGLLVIVHSDHKPLESVVKKSLFKAPKRLQRMLLRMQKYDVQLVHRKGTQMELADTLSRAYLQEEVTPFELGLESINMAQYLPIRREVLKAAVHYVQFRDELSELDGIIFRGNQAVIPSTLRRDMLERIHSAHIEIKGCLRRARECLHWPSISSAVNDYIDKCSICCSFESKQAKETLHSHQGAGRPWAKIKTDLFSCNDLNYLFTVDYYSGF